MGSRKGFLGRFPISPAKNSGGGAEGSKRVDAGLSEVTRRTWERASEKGRGCF